MRWNKALALCLAALFFTGCAVRKGPAPEPVREDPADMALAKAAAAIQKDLRMLAEDEYAGPIPEGGHALQTLVEFKFTGELEDLVREVGRKIGYNVRFTGKRPTRAIMVSVYSIEPITWFHVLQSAGVQAGNRANLEIDDATKSLIVSYGGINKPEPPKEQPKKPARQQEVKAPERVALPVQKPVNTSAKLSLPAQAPKAVQPAPAQPVQTQAPLLIYEGDIQGAQKAIAAKMGYAARIEGPVSRIPVSINSGQKGWAEIIDDFNRGSRFASIFVDHPGKTVILRFWK